MSDDKALPPDEKAIAEAEARAIPVLDAWMVAFNAMDIVEQKKTMHFPHFRLASGKMNKWEFEEMGEEFDVRRKANFKNMEWDHSEWARRNIVQCSDEKIHVDTVFNRYRADGSVISVNQSLYVLTFEDGRWGIKMRSSFAG